MTISKNEENTSANKSESQRIPLAERMRPQTLNDVVGQENATKLLRRIVENGEPASLIFWGPPGTGKTTLARIVANELDADFIEISAVNARKADVEINVERARQNWNLHIRTILFVDEIHRFNKAQQDAFLPHVESGLITLIGATTENPSFEVISPLISRSRVIVLEQLNRENLSEIISRAVKLLKLEKKITNEAEKLLVELAHGDARVALGNLEIAANLIKNKEKITPEIVADAAGKKMPRYDKTGDNHYDSISALHKSLRAGDETAALYYLARMLQSGDDPKYIARRLINFASEDIGLAGNGALGLAINSFHAVTFMGMPECELILAQVVIAFARAKKSREAMNLWTSAKNLAEQFPDSPIPLYVRNAPTKLMKNLGYAKNYEWKTGFDIGKNYLPEEVAEFVKLQKSNKK